MFRTRTNEAIIDTIHADYASLANAVNDAIENGDQILVGYAFEGHVYNDADAERILVAAGILADGTDPFANL